MKKSLSLVALGLLLITCSCNYSKYPIDEKPVVRVDASLYGIWKVASDTDQRNYIHVQDGTEDGRQREDKEHEYLVTYYDNGGKNRHYENFRAFLSNVGGFRFMNLSYWNFKDDDPDKLEREEGYLVYKIISVNANATRIKVALVDDIALEHSGSAAEVRKRVTENLHNRAFFADTVELYNVARGNFSRERAAKMAN